MTLLRTEDYSMLVPEMLRPESENSGLNRFAKRETVVPLNLADPPNLCKQTCNMEPLMTTGHYFVSREISRHPTYFSAPATYKVVLQTILDRMNFKVEKFDDHGEEITLQPGQLICTIRQLAEWANVDKNSTERAIAKFTKVKILRQEVRHKKTILTLSQEYIFASGETRSETKVRQERDIKEKGKKGIKENTHIRSYSLSACKLLEFFIASLKKYKPEISKFPSSDQAKHFDELLKTHSAEVIKSVITYAHTDVEFWKDKINMPLNLVKGTKDNPDRMGMLLGRMARDKIGSQKIGVSGDRRTKNIDGTPVESPHEGRF